VCGRVIEELRRQGVLDHTLVVFTGDNGYFHAEHGLADKWYPYEESIRTPLIVWDPRLPAAQRGRSHSAITLNVDLAPTFLAAAGIPAPPRMQGMDLSPLYLGTPPPTWRTEFFYEHATIRDTSFIPSSQALVRKDEKYILWPDFNHEQYFDLLVDPLEQHDRITDPALQPRLLELRQRFLALKEAAR
jgi:arylsulfatase